MSVPQDSELIVKVKTGDRLGDGTVARVSVAFVNQGGSISQEFALNARWRDNFELGSLDEAGIGPEMANFGPIAAIEIWRDFAISIDRWFVQWVTVTEVKADRSYIFPIHRWIPAGKRLRIYEFDATLPQSACNPDARQQELDAKRLTYQKEVKLAGWLPQVKEVPSDESFSIIYKFDIVSLETQMDAHMKLQSILTGKWENYEEIFSLYNKTFEKPLGSKTWRSDEAFGTQRLNHCNPTVIRRCKEIPEKFAVTEEMMKPILGGLSIQQAIDAKRLYYIDYKVMDKLPCPNNRVIPAPFGLFFVNDVGKLLPAAIQLFQEPGDNNPVFLPTDDEHTWLLAKMFFNTADCSFHQTCTHLGFTHLMLEPIAVATHRHLSPSHPMFRLLAPHFLYLMAINSRGLNLLISPGGWVDKCMTIGTSGMFNLAGRQLANWRLDVQGILPRDLEERGVDDPEALPNYYYRDDALLIFKAIENYVKEVVNSFYDSPEKVREDYELQSWGKTLVTPTSEGGTGVPGVPADGRFENAEELVEMITALIFMASAAHAACNFSQYDDYGFPPNYPPTLHGEVIKDKRPRTKEEINQILPSKQETIDTLKITRLLSMRATKSLGDFEVQYLFDPASEKAIANFRKELEEVGLTIDKRNQYRAIPYTYLHPKDVPNAISI